MPCLVTVIALLFPRIAIVILWFFSNWFDGVFDGILIPILGLLFLPVTMLWYSVVVNYYGGEWNTISIIGMVIAVIIDLGGATSARR